MSRRFILLWLVLLSVGAGAAPLELSHPLLVPRTTYLTIESIPPGATVYDRNYNQTEPEQGALGKTPLVLPLDRNFSHVLWIRRHGYQMERAVVSPVDIHSEAPRSGTLSVALKPGSLDTWLLVHPVWVVVPLGLLGLVLGGAFYRFRFLHAKINDALQRDPSMVGRVINEYRIVKELGEGGSASVYLAEHRQFGERFALKLLKKEVTSPTALERFSREMALGLELRHPSLTRVWAYGTYHGRPYMVMDFVAGKTLSQVQSELPQARLLEIFSQVCEALGALHAMGMVHRDVKPDNVMVLDDGTVRLLDFGVAKSIDLQGLTATGTALGTPLYMSPEHLNAKAVDLRSDIYSAGVVLFFLLTGNPPFRGETIMEVLGAHLHELPPLEELPGDAPPHLLEVLERMLSKYPESRYSTMAEVQQALRANVLVAP